MSESKDYLLGLLEAKPQQNYLITYKVVNGERVILSKDPIQGNIGFDIGIEVLEGKVPVFHSEEEIDEWDRAHPEGGW